jgi:UDP:flavonoid glycosyltransferase YjiC (YdhE family)
VTGARAAAAPGYPRVLFAVSNWTSHYFPLVPLAWALQARGASVRVLCPAGQAGNVAAAGLVALPRLMARDVLVSSRTGNYQAARAGRWPYPVPPPHPVTGAPLDSLDDFDFETWAASQRAEMYQAALASTDAAVKFSRSWRPDVVVHDPQCLEGPLAARAAGVAAYAHLWGPVGFGDVGAGLVLTQPDFSGAFARHALERPQPDGIIDPCPADVSPVAAGPSAADVVLAERYVPYHGAALRGTGPGDLGSGRWICVVWGHTATATFGRVTLAVPRIAKAADELGLRTLLLAAPDDLAACGALPASVRTVTGVPLRLALPGCVAAVHYGGAGSVMAALSAGVPQLALPCGLDQDVIARRVADAGAGMLIPNHLASTAAIGAALDRLLGNAGHAAAAARQSAQMGARPTPAAVAKVLAAGRLAGTGRVR